MILLFERILNDIAGTFKFIHISFIIAMGVVIAYMFIKNGLGKKFFNGKVVILFLLAFYIAMVVNIALISREPGSRIGAIDWAPFSTFTRNTPKVYFFENIVMFIPMGILLPMFFGFESKFRYALPSFVLLSVSIETVQLLTERGYCQLEDVITNTVGGLIGFAIYLFCRKMFSRGRY